MILRKDKDDSAFCEPAAEYNARKDFTTLDCWKKAREVRLFFINQVIPRLPKEQRFNLSEQIQRAVISITANIAEGYGRFHYREGIQFYRISRGSLYELKDHLISCIDYGYIDEKLKNTGLKLIEKAKISLNGFIKFIHRQMQSG